MRAGSGKALASVVFLGGVLFLLSGAGARLTWAQASPGGQGVPAIHSAASTAAPSPQGQARPGGQAKDEAAAQKKAAAAPASEKAETPSYVGSDTCKACHEDLYNGWEKTPHWKITYRKTNNHGCESCHGPGSVHVEAGGQTPPPFDFTKMPVKEINERCLSCHEGGKQQMNFEHSTHAQQGVACTDCHSPHHAVETQTLLVKEQPQLCFGCHATVQAQFRMPWHHKVDEGLIKCTDCHNPHGSFIETQLRSGPTGDAVCFKCHQDKEGPFVFEHEPVKAEGCTACHIPHGSPNQHLLRYANVNQLCLQCHTVSNVSAAPGTPSFHRQTAQFQACTLCHTQVHGSNFDVFFFK